MTAFFDDLIQSGLATAIAILTVSALLMGGTIRSMRNRNRNGSGRPGVKRQTAYEEE